MLVFLLSLLVLDQIFLSHPVVLELNCYRTRAKRLINESNTTGELRKIWTGRYVGMCLRAFRGTEDWKENSGSKVNVSRY